MVCSWGGMIVISCRGRVRLWVMPLQPQKGWKLGDGGVHGSWEEQLDCKTEWTGKNGKNSCNSRKTSGNKQDVRRNYNKLVEGMWGEQQAWYRHWQPELLGTLRSTTHGHSSAPWWMDSGLPHRTALVQHEQVPKKSKMLTSAGLRPTLACSFIQAPVDAT